MSEKRILIIGGVAGGASFATRARRLSETAKIIIFERGDYISFANCGLPYHIGGEIRMRDNLLLQTPEKMRQRYNIEVRVNNEVLKIDRAAKNIMVRNNATGREYSEPYDVLLLSPGAQPIVPPIPGIKSAGIFTLRNIADMDAINNWIDGHHPRHALVVGGGYIGLEMAEALHRRHLQVTLVEMAPQVMSPIDTEMAALLHQELIAQGITLRLGMAATAFEQRIDDSKIVATLATPTASDEVKAAVDMVIFAVGVKPEIGLAKDAGLKIGERGGIVVDEHLQTSDPDIYAVGDAIEVTDFVLQTATLVPLAGPANRQGRIAADNILGRKSSIYKGTQGTGVCKVFKLTVGMTGINEKTLLRTQKNYEKIYLHALDHASYYPGATQISLKLLFNPESGAIYGAQAIGVKGVERRIDVLAMALRAKLTVVDLVDAELSYAPPYGSAKDSVNYAGFVAANVMNGEVKICHTSDILHADKTQQIILDVRTKDEVLCGTIPGAINLPLDELRERLDELPRDKEILVFCKVGLRGYLAYRILTQHGFKCRNLSGGYTNYLMATFTVNNEEQKMSANDTTVEKNLAITVTKSIDARGLQCPGPIQQLKTGIDALHNGETLAILTSDPGFLADAPAWCKATGHVWIASAVNEDGVGYRTLVCKSESATPQIAVRAAGKKMTIVVFSGDLDKALAALIIANGAVAMGYEPTLFFTFWGLNVLRKDTPPKVEKTLIEKMFGFMMPRGAKKLALSKMHMCGLGTEMIKSIMHYKNVNSLPELIASAQQAKVKLIACHMSMDLMGIKLEELIDNIEVGGVATYLQEAVEGNINLFI